MRPQKQPGVVLILRVFRTPVGFWPSGRIIHICLL